MIGPTAYFYAGAAKIDEVNTLTGDSCQSFCQQLGARTRFLILARTLQNETRKSAMSDRWPHRWTWVRKQRFNAKDLTNLPSCVLFDRTVGFRFGVMFTSAALFSFRTL